MHCAKTIRLQISHTYKYQNSRKTRMATDEREFIDIETAMTVYRSKNNEAPNYLSSLLEMFSQNTIR